MLLSQFSLCMYVCYVYFNTDQSSLPYTDGTISIFLPLSITLYPTQRPHYHLHIAYPIYAPRRAMHAKHVACHSFIKASYVTKTDGHITESEIIWSPSTYFFVVVITCIINCACISKLAPYAAIQPGYFRVCKGVKVPQV